MNPRTEASYWDERYRKSEALWSGKPNPQLVDEVAALAPGRALDVGCGEGADAIWLADRNWSVLAIDISTVALERGAAESRAAGDAIAARITWQQTDFLTWSPAECAFDLVSSHFIHVEKSDRDPFFRRLAAGVAPGGTLLVVGHHPSDRETTVRRPRGVEVLFVPDDVLAALDASDWLVTVADARPRNVTDGEGRAVVVHDTIVRAQRNML